MSDVRIRTLGKDSAHLIATGQVVSSVSSAVKELLENALDAKPRDIEVVLAGKGVDLIEVRDSGHGIRSADFDSLARPHSTSKLAAFDGLGECSSFGFRGEALNALATLGKLTITTRHESESVAHCLSFDSAGRITQDKPCARQVGTTVSVGELFHSFPVRRRELVTNSAREWKRVLNIVSGFALIASPVRFCLRDAGRKEPVLMTEGRGLQANARRLLGEVFGSLLPLTQVEPSVELCEDMGTKLEVCRSLGMSLEGLMSSYEEGSSSLSRDRQFLFINHRPCEFPMGRKMLNELYRQYKKGSKHGAPIFIIDISLPTDKIDVNASADKREVLVEEERSVLCVLKASALALMDTAGSHCPSLAKPATPASKSLAVPPASRVKEVGETSTSLGASLERWDFSHRQSPSKRPLAVCNDQAHTTKKDVKQSTAEEGAWRSNRRVKVTLESIRNRRPTQPRPPSPVEREFTAGITSSQNEAAEAELKRYLNRQDFCAMRVVGQFNLGFIIAELEGRELFVVDQHASDEKANFEALQSDEEIQSQRLIAFPLPLGTTSPN